MVGYALKAGPLEDFPQIANPYGVDSPIVGMVRVAGSVVAAGSLVASAISLIVRMRHAGSEQRQQIKWLAYGGTVVVGTICVSGLINLWSVPVGIVVGNVALLGLPVFTGIAIIKHHLYDIDLLINRTLVYGSLTTMLVAVYVGGIVLSQQVFVGLTGQEELPQLAIVASTLLIAALFDPLRRRIQSLSTGVSTAGSTTARKTLELRCRSGTRRTWSAKQRTGRGSEGDDAAGARHFVAASRHGVQGPAATLAALWAE